VSSGCQIFPALYTVASLDAAAIAVPNPDPVDVIVLDPALGLDAAGALSSSPTSAPSTHGARAHPPPVTSGAL
jgi:hypothetical protein